MSIVSSLIARTNNSKESPLNLNKKDKISNLKIDIIIDNTAKIRGDNDPDFSNNKSDFGRENRYREKPYNKENNNRSKKIQVTKLNKYYKKRKKSKF